jgi:hypothetical protein
LESHQAFQHGDGYAPVIEYLSTLCQAPTPGTAEIEVHFFPIDTRHLHAILRAPTTEIFTFRIADKRSPSEFLADWSHFDTFLKDRCHADSTSSQALEDERLVLYLVGWLSRAGHLKFMEEPWFDPEVAKHRGGWENAKLGHVDFEMV